MDRAPISERRFLAEFMIVWSRSGLAGSPRVTFCDRVEGIHRRNKRRFAETDVAKAHFYFAHSIRSLPPSLRLGLIAHEVGHALHGRRRHSEDDADFAARQVLGVAISYERRGFPGKGVQRGRWLW